MKSTITLLVAGAIWAVCVPVFGEYSLSTTRTWPNSWPKELELLRKQALKQDQKVSAKPAQIRLRSAGASKIGGAPGFSLAGQVSNPNQKVSLRFIGYRPDSFAPPLPKGQISPIYKIEVKRDGKWHAQPRGYCGTGMDAIALAPQAKATFGAWVAEGDWQSVRIGVTWTTVPFKDAGKKPGDFTTLWSNEITHKEAMNVP